MSNEPNMLFQTIPYEFDFQYFRDCRKQFATEEWIDVLYCFSLTLQVTQAEGIRFIRVQRVTQVYLVCVKN